MADKDSYIAQFRAADGPAWLRQIRESAIERFAESGFPTPRDEQWRFTRVRPLLQHDFTPAGDYQPNGLTVADVQRLTFVDDGCHRLVFVNGRFAPELSNLDSLPKGVLVESLAKALTTRAGALENDLSRHANISKNPFVALNTANLVDGAYVFVPASVTVDRPLHLVFITGGAKEPRVAHPRCLIVAEPRSRATIVESYTGHEGDIYFANAVTEICIGEEADIDHYKLQNESMSAYHFATLETNIGRNGRFNTDSISLGGALVRNDVTAVLDGERIECRLDGLYLADGHRHVDNHTNLEHAKPHCESHELYKGILRGRAKAVFNGRIHVHPDAQKTDAKQSNRCVLLSDDAQINTNPQLEIYADDVKCTHGAAVGRIDENAVFYLRSRGIAEDDARRMLVRAFANEVLEKIQVAPLRERLGDVLSAWLSEGERRAAVG